jgi:high-affinity Fe2+/Pb2+ permease
MAATILSILMLAGIALLAGGLHLIIRKRDKKRGLLMLIAAAVMFGNVAIWLAPTQSGQTLSGQSGNEAR